MKEANVDHESHRMTPEEKAPLFKRIVDDVRAIIDGPGELESKMQDICQIMANKIGYYDWVGFYLVCPDKERCLYLGPFVGDPTEHVNIQFGEGICGQSAETKQIFVVPNVCEVTNYLSCSPKVQSEIVVPIMDDEKFLGELDIDSHLIDPFSKEDEDMLQAIADMLASHLELDNYICNYNQ